MNAMTLDSLAPVALPQVRLKMLRRSAHPWIFQKMVEKPATRLPGGTIVDILDRDGQWVGRGFWNGHYDNKQIDDLIDKEKASTDTKTRTDAFAQI